MKKGILFAALTAILFATLEPVSAEISANVSPFAITFWRFIIGGLMLLPFAIIKMKKQNIKMGLKDIAIITLLGIFFICISMITLQIGVGKAKAAGFNPAIIAIIFSSNAIFTILFSLAILKEKMTTNKAIALLLGICGVLLCSDLSSGANLESVIYAVVAALTFSLYTVLSKKFMTKFGGIIQMGFGFVLGCVALLIFMLVMGIINPGDIAYKVLPYTWNFGHVLILLYLGVFVTGLGYLFYFKGMEHGGALMASLAFFIKPVLTPFVALIVNGIAPDWKVFAAVACIVGASYFATYRKAKN